MKTSIINTLGIEASTFEKTLNASSLNWEPMSDKVGGMDTAIEMPRKKLLYRSDNKLPLGIVGNDYQASDPKAFLKGQFEFAEFIKGKVVRAGFMDERARCFAFVKMGEEIVIPRGIRKVGDPIQAYIYSTDGWDGGTPRRARLYIERLRCANGQTSKEIKADLWVSHTSKLEENYAARWKNFLAEVRVQINLVREQFVTLAKTRMSEEECKAFLAKLIPGEGARQETRRTEMFNLFGEKGEGNEGSSRWDAYNAVTEFVTHHRTYRETDTTSESTNRFLGVLETDTLSRNALSLLLN